MNEIRRIYITGGAGVGKTTLARKLADATGFERFELDSLLWAHADTGERVSPQERTEIVADIAVKSNWIVDGVNVGWAQEIWRTADLVIFLDLPLWVMLWRVFWRHVKAEIRRNNRHPGWLNLFRFLRIIARSHWDPETGDIDDDEDRILTHAKIAAKVQQQKHKTFVVNENPDIEQILGMINSK